MTDARWATLPKPVSPVFVTEIDRAQTDRPTTDQVRLNDGGHEPFSSASR